MMADLLLLGKPYAALFLTCLWKARYWVYHTKYHHNLDETLQRVYVAKVQTNINILNREKNGQKGH